MGYAILVFLIVFLLLSSGLLLLFYREALGRRLASVLVQRSRPGLIERFKRVQTAESFVGSAELIRRNAPSEAKRPAIEHQLTLAGYRQAFHKKLFSASKIAVPVLLVVIAAVTGLSRWNTLLVFA